MQPWGTRKIDVENVNKSFIVIASQQQHVRKIKSFQIILAAAVKKIRLEKILTETTDDDVNIITNINILKEVFQMCACCPDVMEVILRL